MSSRRGFTLIELTIVVVVIGILATVALPRFNMTAHKSKEKEADILLKQVFTLQETYVAARGMYASTAAQLAEIGFEAPQESGMKYYAWAAEQSVKLPLCLQTSPPGAEWQGRSIDLQGFIRDC